MSVRPPDWMTGPLSYLGMHWPDADPPRLSMMSDDWGVYSGKLWSQLRTAETAAEDVLTGEAGKAIDAFEEWWKRTRGPGENLELARQRAENIGAGLKSLATHATIMQAVWVAEFYALVATIALIAKAVAIGGITAAAGATARKGVEHKVQERLSRKVLKWLVPIAAGGLIWQTFIRPYLPPPVPDYEDPPDPRCYQPPMRTAVPPVTGNWDVSNLTAGGGIFKIDGQRYLTDRVGPNGEEIAYFVVTIDGVVQPSLTQRFDYEEDMRKLGRRIQIVDHDASHSWSGKILGTEAKAGIFLAPTIMNTSDMVRAERFLQRRHRELSMEGGWLAVHTQATTHPMDAYTYWERDAYGNEVSRHYGGHRLLESMVYSVKECRPVRGGGAVEKEYEFSIEVGPPGPDGTPGRIVRRNWTW